MPVLLIVCASPLDQDRLRLGAEVKEIRNALKRSRNREQWTIESNEAVTVDDLRRALLDHRPAIVHFSGHGDTGGLCFESDEGLTHAARVEPTAKLLHAFKADLKCVVLNACYSEDQAELIRKEIDYVVGMRSAVRDDVATKFSLSFYDAVFAGVDFRAAFDLGCTAIDLNDLPGTDVPVFLTAEHLGHLSLSYHARVPEIESFLHSYVNTPYNERTMFTTTGAEIAALQKRHYGDAQHGKVDSVRILATRELDSSIWIVTAELNQGKNRSKHNYYIHLHGRSILLEWEATAGIWSVPPKTYLAMGADGPVVARVTAELSSYYNYTFNDDMAPRYQSIELTTFKGPHLHGYVRKGTPTHQELMAILMDGNEHDITVEISNVGHPSTSRIDRLLSRSWIYRSSNEKPLVE